MLSWSVAHEEEWNEKLLLLDWLAVNLVSDRSRETKELFLYGDPNGQGVLILEMLSNVLPIVWGTDKSRKKDFLKCQNSNQLWIIQDAGSSASSWGWRQEGKSLSRRLLSLLDLKDWKRKQMANVPLIILGDSLPTSEALSTLHGRKGSCLLSSFPTYLSWVRKGSLPHSGELFLLEPAHRISFGIQPFPTILWELGITCFILWMSLLRIPLNMDLYMRGSKISSFLMRGMVLTPPRDLKRFFFYYPSS